MIHGLLNTKDNKFYFLADNHHRVKILQLLTMKHRLFLCVNISRISDLVINEDDCHRYGVSKPLIKFLTPDIDTTRYGAAVVDSPEDRDETLWHNIHALDRLVTVLENFVGHYETTQKDRFEDMINGLRELESFVTSFIPDDPNIKEFVDREIETKTSIIDRANRIKCQIFAEVMQADPWKNDFVQDLRDRITTIESIDIELLNMMKTVCLTKL